MRTAKTGKAGRKTGTNAASRPAQTGPADRIGLLGKRLADSEKRHSRVVFRGTEHSSGWAWFCGVVRGATDKMLSGDKPGPLELLLLGVLLDASLVAVMGLAEPDSEARGALLREGSLLRSLLAGGGVPDAGDAERLSRYLRETIDLAESAAGNDPDFWYKAFRLAPWLADRRRSGMTRRAGRLLRMKTEDLLILVRD